MKQKLKQILKITLICISIFLTSCEKDTIVNEKSEPLNFKRVSLEDIPFIKNDIVSKQMKFTNKQGVTDYLGLIKPDQIIVQKDKEGRKTYTFALDIEEVTTLTNLVIKETNNGLNYDLIKYTSSNIEAWKSSIKEGQNPTIDVSIDVESLELESSNESSSKTC